MSFQLGFSLLTALILGDSHLEGEVGRTLKTMLTQQGYVVKVGARRGLSAIGLQKIPLTARADLLIIVLGTNDVPSARTQAAYKALKERFPQAWVVGPPMFKKRPLNRKMRLVRHWQELYFRGRFIDSWKLTQDLTQWGRTKDQIHFDAQGGFVWGYRIWEKCCEEKARR